MPPPRHKNRKKGLPPQESALLSVFFNIFGASAPQIEASVYLDFVNKEETGLALAGVPVGDHL
jgi:hypothetical protein